MTVSPPPAPWADSAEAGLLRSPSRSPWSLKCQMEPSLLGEKRLASRLFVGCILLGLLVLGILCTILPLGKDVVYGPGAGSVFSSTAFQPATVTVINSAGLPVTVSQTAMVPAYDSNGQPLYVPLVYPNGSIVYVNGVQQNLTDSAGNMVPLATQQIVSTPALLPQYAGYGAAYVGVNDGDTAWVLTSAALVLLMTPGLAFFYGGMVQSKNIVSTLFQSYMSIAIVTMLWTFVGFSLAFGPDLGSLGILGDPAAYFFYKGVGALPISYDLNPNLAYPPTIPFSVYSVFQLGFAAVTPAIITGSFAERVRFGPVCLFIALWHIIVYCPIAHAVWSPFGLLKWWGTLDFAGGAVVHMASGWAALVGSWFIGRREASNETPIAASVPYVMLGTALLWFGWFGFNAGSAGAANALAGQAFVNTNAAAAACMAAWVCLDCIHDKPASAVSACIGAVVGLIVITPGAGFVSVGAAVTEGIIGALVCYHVQNFVMSRSSLDDALDSFTAHGVGGAVGCILVGCFADPKINPITDNGGNLMVGLFYGGTGRNALIVKQLVALVCLIPFFILASYICYKVTDLIHPLRVDPNDERLGLDAQQGLGTDVSIVMVSSAPRSQRTLRPGQTNGASSRRIDRSARSEVSLSEGSQHNNNKNDNASGHNNNGSTHSGTMFRTASNKVTPEDSVHGSSTQLNSGWTMEKSAM